MSDTRPQDTESPCQKIEKGHVWSQWVPQDDGVSRQDIRRCLKCGRRQTAYI